MRCSARPTAVGTAARVTSARDGRTARGGRPAAVAQRQLLLPAFHAVQDRVGWVSRGALNYICRRLIVPPAEAWGVLTFYHLFATEPRPPRRRARLRRHRVPRARRRGAVCRPRRATGAGRHAARRRHLDAQPVSGAVRARSCGARGARRGHADPRGRRPGGRGHGGPARLPRHDQHHRVTRRPPPAGATSRAARTVAAEARRRGGSDLARGLSRGWRLPGAGEGDGPRTAGRHRRSDRRAAHGPRRCGVPDRQEVGGGGCRTGAAALRRLQCRRVRTRHLQGPRADERRSVRHRGSDDDLRHSPPAARAASCTSAGSIPRPRPGSPARWRRRTPPGCSATTSPARGIASTSRCGAAPAPTSAAKRPRSSTRSKASAASRGRSRRFRRRSACSVSPPSSTTSRRWPMCSTSCCRAARRGRPPAPRRRPGRGCSACRDMSPRRGSTSFRSARPCAR